MKWTHPFNIKCNLWIFKFVVFSGHLCALKMATCNLEYDKIQTISPSPSNQVCNNYKQRYDGGIDFGLVLHARTQHFNLFMQRYLHVLRAASKQSLISSSMQLLGGPPKNNTIHCHHRQPRHTHQTAPPAKTQSDFLFHRIKHPIRVPHGSNQLLLKLKTGHVKCVSG